LSKEGTDMKIYIRGVYYDPVVKERHGETYKEVILRVFKNVLKDAGISRDEVEGIVFTPPALGGLKQHFMHAHHMGHYLGQDFKVEVMVENGGSTAALAIRYAMLEIMSGRCKSVMVICLDDRSDRIPEGMEFPHFIYDITIAQINLYGPFDSMYGIGAPIPYYAMAGQRYMYEKKVSREDLNYVAVRLRENAQNNEKALIRELIKPEDVTASKEICPPLHLHDCSIFAAGAAGILLVSEEFEKSNPSKKRRVSIRGYGEYHTPTSFLPNQLKYVPYYSEATRKATKEAFSQAKIKPQDVDVAEIYGVFSTTELTILEDMGFFEEGKSVYAFKEGNIGRESKLYVDPSGGRIACGHPAGATPAIEMCEVVTQLRGEGNTRQKKGRCDIGVVQAEHGMLNGSVVFVLEGEG
jgi:acetyl-CoA C-acetyltransferase